MKSLQGRLVLILDAGCPLGHALALECARIGARLALWASHRATADRVAADVVRCHGITVCAYQVDLTQRESIEAGVDAVRRDFPRIDVVICNMDELHGLPILVTPPESIRQTIQVNGLATMWTTRLVLPQMIEQKGGHIVFFGTVAETLGASKLVDYCASKYMVMGFYEALRHELRRTTKLLDKDLNLTLVCPTLLSRSHGAPEENGPFFTPIWLEPEPTARNIVRAIRKNQSKLVLPPDFSMITGLLSILPARAAQWVREKLRLSNVMDHYRVPTATPYAYAAGSST
ncbi:hypothetical protein Poli38472_012534 [Pythium oligandrum]|uniref:Uncharacterized protein n=1 Tax=Pythium oligandrum TaxID=41045 RepID=A0A8K1CF06_PYTOL|nr:hypothetical protein Poli38472_012534 [Pythium oligandrum]|eukprot:TMW61343.1 hypothetical protein Poli38472_012534 [Pythium oligandrum]